MSIAADPTPQPTAQPLILSRREGAITRITLNRPRALNALNHEMFRGLHTAVAAAQTSESAAILLDGAGDRGFCGGGDIKEMSEPGGREILASEYRVDHEIATSRVPVVGFMDGITMGGGIGLTAHADFRLVTERSRLAMPEVRIGISPDVGGNLLLARAPGRLGELLAATAVEMTPGDAIALGFADYFVPSDRLAALAEALAAGEAPGVACARLAQPAPEAPLLAARSWWDPIAEEALADAERAPKSAALRLVAALEASEAVEAGRSADAIRSFCPTCVAVALSQIARTRRLGSSLAEVLEDDLRVVGRLAGRYDFAEGARAQVIDKDRNPRWSPASLEELDDAELSEILAPDLRPDETPLGL